MHLKLLKYPLNSSFAFRVKKTSRELFSSKNFSSDESDKPLDSESRVKSILRASSPLKTNIEDDGFFAASPYPKGTVFMESDVSKSQKDMNPEPQQCSIIMFPGQGNQFVGMSKNLINYPVVKDMFGAASSILGYNLLKLCSEGPEEKLNKTEFCQPAMLVCSLAALEKLKDEKPWAINNCVGTCGFSLGELAALVFAGCITFEKAISLVKLRAEAMQLCCQMTPGGMMTVLYGPGSELSKALIDANDHCKTKGIRNAHCSIATYLFPGCKVIAGHVDALNFLIENGHKYRLRKLSKLPVSGAFHTNLMKEASIPFENVIEKLDIKEPIIKVYSNVNGKPYKNTKDIRKKLPKQIYLPVKWEQTMQNIYERPQGTGFPFTYECGPGKSLSVVLKKINVKASGFCYSVQV
ncbi:hypothetical protein RUM44_009931 [Polyplax serrata]|uniref:Malonyl-CoA:ACP transacylase (MAT) domain-containing protein n=1 Tax=Polyplax serrata TaxID=468196 RepID=A0ABR1AU37_POLSC